jgi:hypothetical protein
MRLRDFPNEYPIEKIKTTKNFAFLKRETRKCEKSIFPQSDTSRFSLGK